MKSILCCFALGFGISAPWVTGIVSPFPQHRVYDISLAGESQTFGGESITLIGTNRNQSLSVSLALNNYAMHAPGEEVTAGGGAPYCLDAYSWGNNGGRWAPGQRNPVQGFLTGDQGGVGVSGCGLTYTPGVSNIGTSGVAGSYGAGGQSAGMLASVIDPFSIKKDVLIENAALLVETHSTGLPAIVARRNNGTHVFDIANDGTMTNAPPPGLLPVGIRFGKTIDGRLMVEADGQIVVLE